MDHVADEVHDQPQEAVVDDVVIDAQGFPGEPHDTSILMDYVSPSCGSRSLEWRDIYFLKYIIFS